MASFEERLKSLRKSQGWSQDVLADKLGTTRSCIGNYEQGTRMPDIETLEQIADFFNVDMPYLLGRQDEPRRVDLSKPSLNDFEMVTKIIDDLRWNTNDVPLRLFDLQKALEKNHVSIKQFAKWLEEPLESVEDLVTGKRYASMNEVGRIKRLLNDTFIDAAENSRVGNKIVKQLLDYIYKSYGYPISKDRLLGEESTIIDAYRSSDDLTKAMVRRTLGIE